MSEIRVGRCHCEAIVFQVELENGLKEVKRCNCSLCLKKGAIIGSVESDKIIIIKGKENLSLYQWNTKVAKHYFCKTCGIYTHNQKRSNPKQYGFNIACLDGVNPLDYENVAIGNGKSMSLI